MPEDISQLIKRFRALQKQIASFRIIGGGDLDVQGSFEHGFAVNLTPSDAATAAVAVTYNCVDGVCVDPGDGTGTYATLDDCEADCGRCPDADCDNQPTTMRLSFTVSGTYPTSADCNDEIDYALPDITGDSGAIDVTDQDGIDDNNCGTYSITEPNVPYSYTCLNEACSDSSEAQGGVQLVCQEDGHWLLSVSIVGSPFCNPGLGAWGGDPLVTDVDVGTNPAGTHSFSLNDPVISGIHYEIEVVIT